MIKDPIHAQLVHSVASRLSERGRRWPFHMGMIECLRQLNMLPDTKLQELCTSESLQDRAAFLKNLKGAGIQ